MCGIAGSMKPAGNARAIVSAMVDTLYHRGPDAGGVWSDDALGVALGHRRLSILDLSAAGSQPMQSVSGRYVLSYNGEIYNFSDLRGELEREGYPFQGHSDTEVLVAAIQHWGIDQALQRINGMFAFAVWDSAERVLTLARDRVGKKPLYYGWCDKAFLFGSELKALRTCPGFDDTINRNALGEYLRFGWVPEPLSIFSSVRKLAPGCLLRVKLDAPPWSSNPERYWRADEMCTHAQQHAFSGSYQEAVDQLDSLLGHAVQDRMVADVDLGALLSGGVDSTTMVALMQQASQRPVKTFCIGFTEPRFNEAEYAASIAAHLGTEHHELYVTSRDCLDVVERLPVVYDEPFADISQVPTLLVSQMAREHVTVVLSGDGGDELFGGYNHYFGALAQWRRMERLPAALRIQIGRATEGGANLAWRLFQGDESSTGRIPAWQRAAAKLEKRTRGWSADSPQQLSLSRFARHSNPVDLVPGYRAGDIDIDDRDNWIQIGDALLKMRHLDYIGYLPGDILVKVDRASMAVSMEARAPLLDTRVAEFAWSLPTDYLVDAQGGKRVLRDVMAKYVPRNLTERPKRGFGAPVDDWLRGDLREWALDLLDASCLEQQGLFDVVAVKDIWKQHQRGWRNHANLLWALLMFQAWLGTPAAA